MYSFANDYSEGAHPKILDMMIQSNLEQNVGYGKDEHCARARANIKRHLHKEDVDIHFISGGTQTNLLAVSSFLRPHQCVISADTGHINVHETGAIEATGHKVFIARSKQGKLLPEGVLEAIAHHKDEHMVQPKMVYISDSTELGTIYSKAELTELHNVCKDKGLLLFLDGARLGSALTCSSNDLLLTDIAELTDVFYIGGTKNGALLGEALVITRDDLKVDFRYLIKQRGAMLAKGFVIGMQFEVLFDDNLFFELGAHANLMAQELVNILKELNYPLYTPSCTNQLFPILPDELLKPLSQSFRFEYIAKYDERNSVIRLVTSWATTNKGVKLFSEVLSQLKTQFDK
ncbi:MAG: aminotransferase class V-fold PLP-dependent enzyme [Eubacteriales bacterium]|nr:aminotransferase class V-fold PLP-dependent enzyme [Eubacteriales bacterium]